jgi:hypothetical protein
MGRMDAQEENRRKMFASVANGNISSTASGSISP